MLSVWLALLVSMQGHSRGGSEVTEESVRSDCGKDGWLVCGGKAPLYWWFSDGLVSLLVIYIVLTSSLCVKISVG